MRNVLGKDLKVEDTIETWWGWDTIIALVPYTGPLAHLWNKYDGVPQTASFARFASGMTIEPQMMYQVR